MDSDLWKAETHLVLYHEILRTGPGPAMLRFLRERTAGSEVAAADPERVRAAYLELVREVYRIGPRPGPAADPWQNHLIHQLLTAENAFTRAVATGQLSPALRKAAAYDLRILQGLSGLTGEACQRLVEGGGELPTWGDGEAAPRFTALAFRRMAERLAESADWAALVDELAAFHQAHGVGVVGVSWFLSWDGSRLQPVEEPDLIDLDDLAGLAEQKQAIQASTEAFLRGAPGQNLLLYGPRGTGKSSLVRGLALRYGGEGLRVVEVGRGRLERLADLFRQVRVHPQRFILFLDDLAFEADDAEYRAFKSILEGALERRPSNLVLYATTNRRHMIPERWADRNSPEQAEVHGQDAMEERLSLADRFGRTILFLRPDQEEYLAIVEHLAARRGLPIEREELREQARRWALWQNAPSGRSARQFADELAGRLLQ